MLTVIVYSDVVNVQPCFNFSDEIIILNFEFYMINFPLKHVELTQQGIAL